jgi:predicted RNA-binding Zn-ribbon protein involved in translation (DUF1610 family)
VLDKATSYDDLVRKLKEHHCPNCELNLFCTSGRAGGISYWCRNCSGYFVPELKAVVHCSGFPARAPRFVPGVRQERSERFCGACRVSPLSTEQQEERRRIRHIHGFVAEDTEHCT